MKSTKWILIVAALFGCLSAINLHHGSAAQQRTPTITNIELPEETIYSDQNCPVGMIKVEGDYCHFAYERCLKWIDSKNKYPYMCERFEFPTKCLSGKTHMSFCIDKYEAQDESGQIPEVFIDWFTAQSKCEAAGKRLCDVRELTLACEGPKMKPYPYGYVRDTSKCNIGNVWIDPNKTPFEKMDRRVPSGNYDTCKSDFGVYDGVGNVDEWAVNKEGSMLKAPFKSALFGGHYVSGIRNRCRDQGVPSVTTSHGPTAKNYEISYRCCSDLNGSI